jgi:endonuclease YncB( thermonuclease family)
MERAGEAVEALNMVGDAFIRLADTIDHEARYAALMHMWDYLHGAISELVANGACWEYPAYDKDPLMPALEMDVRAQRRGIWAGRPIPPWVWRRSRP